MFTDMTAHRHLLALLKAHGFSEEHLKVSPNKELVRLTAPVARINSFLGSNLEAFHSTEDDSIRIFRDTAFELPAHLKQVVDHVAHVQSLPAPPSKSGLLKSRESLRARQSGRVTPSLLYSFYGISDPNVKDADATAAVFESLGQSFSPKDLLSFQQKYNLKINPVRTVIGQNNPSNPGGEASLDVQFFNIAQGLNLTYWSIPGNGDIFLDWIEAVSSDANAPLVHSVSYGSIAPEDPRIDVERLDVEVCKVGLRGITLTVSSGDDGVANFLARGNPGQCGFTPSFPATSRYATAVGATQGPEVGKAEVVCSSSTGGLITSGGGFSYFLKRPAYQDAVVKNYLATGPNLPPKHLFKSENRAYPDVAIMGHNYPILVNGQTFIGSGTSASSPVFAAMVTLVNSQRLAAGKKPLGFLNIRLYSASAQTAGIYNPVTSGTNNCCAGNSQPTCCTYGFTAAASNGPLGAWSPTVGFGTIKFGAFAQFFQSTL